MTIHKTLPLACLVAALIAFNSQLSFGQEKSPQPNAKNPAAIKELQEGSRTDANAAWWGFDPADSTDAIQSALNSGAQRVVIPYMGQPWVVRPLMLSSNQELQFETGVVVLAKKGEFLGGGDSLFTARDVEDLHIKGYGATLRMRKTGLHGSALSKSRMADGALAARMQEHHCRRTSNRK